MSSTHVKMRQGGQEIEYTIHIKEKVVTEDHGDVAFYLAFDFKQMPDDPSQLDAKAEASLKYVAKYFPVRQKGENSFTVASKSDILNTLINKEKLFDKNNPVHNIFIQTLSGKLDSKFLPGKKIPPVEKPPVDRREEFIQKYKASFESKLWRNPFSKKWHRRENESSSTSSTTFFLFKNPFSKKESLPPQKAQVFQWQDIIDYGTKHPSSRTHIILREMGMIKSEPTLEKKVSKP